MMQLNKWADTIAAISSPPGVGAIAVIRISGKDAFTIAEKTLSIESFELIPPQKATLSWFRKGEEYIDEVVFVKFIAPHSFTGENVVEYYCHGSKMVQKKILEILIAQGCRAADPGEFTRRAFLNGKMDLTQAEAIGDLIHSESEAARKNAVNHMRGGFANDLSALREAMINFAALLELELDFAEEDVEFADRSALKSLLSGLEEKVQKLIRSFGLGNAIRDGIRVAIVGRPNAGKSTLLNTLLNEERAIVTDIPGTTRDSIEESLHIHDLLFRIIDTAGIRDDSEDVIENIGIARSRKNAEQAEIILWLQDVNDAEQNKELGLAPYLHKTISVGSKADTNNISSDHFDIIVSAKTGEGIEKLKDLIYERSVSRDVAPEDTIVTNLRHQQALLAIDENLQKIRSGMAAGLSNDLLALDMRQCIYHLSEITGSVETDRDILGTIFGKFCIGK